MNMDATNADLHSMREGIMGLQSPWNRLSLRSVHKTGNARGEAVTLFKGMIIVVSYIANMFLQTFDAKRTNDKPKFQRSETTTQWNLPMLEERHSC